VRRPIVATQELSRATFEGFFADAEPRLRHALVAAVGREKGREAVAEALAYGWEHWSDVRTMENPVGYLYRVGRSRVRVRRRRITFYPMAMPDLAIEGASRIPDVEPGLGRAMESLSEHQRSAVFLIHGMGWTRREVADLLGISVSSVGSHLERGLRKLRRRLGVTFYE
jgi:DNA-directed RNA polymerase specialized sigma24 family protein